MQPHTDSPHALSLAFLNLPAFAEYAAGSCQRDLLEARRREVRLSPEQQAFLAAYPDDLHLLALVDDDSPATPVVLPIWAHIAAAAARLDLRVLRQEAAAGMLALLAADAGTRDRLARADLPLLLIFDEEWQLQAQWGPHPKEAHPYLARWGSPHGQSDAHLAQEMRLGYNSGLNRACIEELCSLLAGLQDEDSGDRDTGDEEITAG